MMFELRLSVMIETGLKVSPGFTADTEPFAMPLTDVSGVAPGPTPDARSTKVTKNTFLILFM